MIAGEIRRFLRDDGMIKVSRSLKELSYKAHLIRERLQEELGRDATVQELAQELGVPEEELTMALESSGEVESIYKPVYQKDGNEIQLVDRLMEKEGHEEQILNKIVLGGLLETLKKEERRLIYLRYFKNQTQTQVGKELGIPQVQVSRMEKKILLYLRSQM